MFLLFVSLKFLINHNNMRKYKQRTKRVTFYVLLIFVIVIIVLFFLTLQMFSSKPIQVSQLSPNTPTISFKTNSDPRIIKEGNKISFYDSVNNYYLDLSSLPDVSLTDRDTDDIYEFEMYASNAHSDKGSIARFGLSQPLLNPQGLNLPDFASKQYNYKIGTDNSTGWGPLTTSALKEVVVGNNYPAITWTSESPGNGSYFFNYYLIQIKDRIVFAKLVAWNKKIFDSNITVFRNILNSFRAD